MENGRQKRKPAPWKDWLLQSEVEGQEERGSSRWYRLSAIRVGRLDFTGSLVVSTGAVVLNQGIQGEEVFQQAADAVEEVRGWLLAAVLNGE